MVVVVRGSAFRRPGKLSHRLRIYHSVQLARIAGCHLDNKHLETWSSSRALDSGLADFVTNSLRGAAYAVTVRGEGEISERLATSWKGRDLGKSAVSL